MSVTMSPNKAHVYVKMPGGLLHQPAPRHLNAVVLTNEQTSTRKTNSIK